MKYVGIHLGTTNSAICSFDGEKHLCKSPEQHDVTPSAIFIDRRGNKYVGSRAYNSAGKNYQNTSVVHYSHEQISALRLTWLRHIMATTWRR